MKNIDLTGLSYEQLCELERAIVKRKEDFAEPEFIYIFDDADNEPHLCYCSQYGRGTNPFYSDYYSHFCDIFTEEYVCRGVPTNRSTLLYYLNSHRIGFENKHYSKEELATLWQSIRIRLITAKLDKEQASLNAKQKRLQ